MKVAEFLENFRYVAEAPNGVQRLRELVLQLAVSGDLVEQRATEGSAKDAVALGEEQRLNYQSAFGLRNRKLHGQIEDQEKPFAVPASWQWTRLERVACYIQRGRSPSYSARGRARVISQKCIQWSGFNLSPARYISDDSLDRYGAERFLVSGDILWNSTGTGTAGRVAVFPGADEQAVADSHVTVIRLTNFIPQYIWCYLASPTIQKRMAPGVDTSLVSGTTNQVELSTTKVMELPVPSPPAAEQKRIVAKVDELMALCDKLEAQQQRGDHLFGLLSRARNEKFLSGPSRSGVETLLDKSPNLVIGEFIDTIASLALQGQLGCSAGRVIEHADVSALKKKQIELSKREGLRKRPAVQPVDRGSWPYRLPAHWALTCLDDITVIVSGVTKGRNLSGRTTLPLPYLRVANVQRGELDLSTVKTIEVPEDEKERYRLIPGDVLMTEGGDWDKLGRAAIWNGELEDCIHQNHVYRVRSVDAGSVLPEWIMLFVNSPLGRSYFQQAAKQTTNLASINSRQLRNCPIPLPAADEQRRILAIVQEFIALAKKLASQQRSAIIVAEKFAQAAVAAITGTASQESKPMKAPKTELVTSLEVRSSNDRAPGASEPLAALLAEQDGPQSAKALWQRSGLAIDAFYQQLKAEMSAGWIIEPEPARMREVEAD